MYVSSTAPLSVFHCRVITPLDPPLADRVDISGFPSAAVTTPESDSIVPGGPIPGDPSQEGDSSREMLSYPYHTEQPQPMNPAGDPWTKTRRHVGGHDL